MVFSKARRLGLILAIVLAGFGVWTGTGSLPVALADDKYVPPEVTIESSNPFHNDKEAIKEGAKLYFTFCVACHGHNGDGESRFGKLGYDLRKFWRGYAQFIAIATAGRPEKGMPPWGKYLDGVKLAKIGAYLETLAIEGAYWK